MKNFKPFRYWCQATLPTVYSDALSYGELLCKVVEYLNEIGKNENELVNAFNSLKNFVDNYFESTDFQQMVDNKLDTMAQDGTLDNLINEVLFGEINDRIDTAIEDLTLLINTGNASTFASARAYADQVSEQAKNQAVSESNEYTDTVAPEIAGELDAKIKYHNYIPYPYKNVYVNIDTGSDTNTGTSDSDAFKTLDKALETADTWGDFRIWITAAGDYTMSRPTLNAVTLHIIATVNGVRIVCDPNSGVAVSIYNSHLNFQCRTDDGYLEIYLPQTFGDHPTQSLYFENCATTFNNVYVNSNYAMDLFGGSLVLEGRFKTNAQIVCYQANITFESSGSTVLTNTRNDRFVIGLYRGSKFTNNQSNKWTISSLDTPGASNVSRLIHCDSSILISKGNLTATPLNAKYYYLISATNSFVIMKQTRINVSSNNIALNGCNFAESVVNGVPNGLDA